MKTVLVVDDDSDFRKLLLGGLESRHLRVVQAESIQDGWEKFGSEKLDLMIVDGHLPDGTGIDLIARIRQVDARIPIIFVSAHFRDLATFTQLIGELGVSLVFYKPVDVVDFGIEVEHLLKSSRQVYAAPVAENSTHSGEPSDELAELSRAFRERLPQRLDALEKMLALAIEDSTYVAKARTLAHRLHGTAGSFGFPQVGEAAAKIEELLAGPIESLDELNRHLQLAYRSLESPAAVGPWVEGRLPVEEPEVSSTLLVVDDDPDFLGLVTAMSEQLGIPVATAENGGQALKVARRSRLLGAIVDVHMSQEKGFELARQIRDTGDNGSISIVFASVDHSINTRVSAMEAGGTKFFEKPISKENLTLLLNQFVRYSRELQSRVLVINGVKARAEGYARILRAADLSVETLHSAESLVEKLEEFKPDLLLMDLDLERISGLDICRALRMSDQWEQLPILLSSPKFEVERRVKAFKSGASDVLAEPMVGEEVVARVKCQIDRSRLMKERNERDPLSGLLVRRSFLEAFQRSLAACQRAGTPLAVSLLDLDHFKSINDTYGHLVGDLVINRFGELLQRRFRIDDLRCRWGGEEFLLAFPSQTAEFAAKASARLLEEFSQISFTTEGGHRFQVTFTAGVAAFPNDGDCLRGLVEQADALLYKGKRAGRAQVVVS